jgi:hypothetical protein
VQHVVLRRAQQAGLLRGARLTAIDATGLDARYASTHYRYRYSPRYQQAYAQLHEGRWPTADHWRPRHPKLTVAVDVASHLILGAVPDWGPTHDLHGFAPALHQVQAHRTTLGLRLRGVVADAGYDAEWVHVLCRETLGIPLTAIPLNPRTCGQRGPRTRWRRRMDTAFPRGLYRQRRQVESVFSRLKRRLGAALTARQANTQQHELVLRVLTHNLLLLWRAHDTFQQSR